MADEVVTTRETSTPGDTTIIRETRSGTGAGWVIAVILVIALLAGLWLFSQSNSSEAAKDNAVANAAADVGEAAQDVGDAAQEATRYVNRP